MNAARQLATVSWWRMGRNAAARYGQEQALEMATAINGAALRKLFLSGARGEPRPTLRQHKEAE
jgi:hypothetical protein